MTRILDHDTGELVDPEVRGHDDEYVMLDVYAPGGMRLAEPRANWLATISAGGKNEQGYPVMNRDGRISLHDEHSQAPGLLRALEATAYRSLCIAFASNRLGDILQARFTRHSASSLQVYGDADGLTEIVVRGEEKNEQVERKVYRSTDPGYDAILRTCKVEVSVFFTLAHWEGTQPIIDFPDGVGQWYRLRFTSRHSYQSLVGTLQHIQRDFSGGRLAGIPFELQLTPREVSGPNGRKRDIMVWTLAFRPPASIQLASPNFRGLLSAALAEGASLKVAQLPSPTMEILELEGPDLDLDEAWVEEPTERQRENLTRGDPPCDPQHYRQRWFAAVRGTRLETPLARHELVHAYTRERYAARPELVTDSLATFLGRATEADAAGLLAAAAALVWQPDDEEEPGPEWEPEPEPEEATDLLGEPSISDPQDQRWRGWLTLLERTADELHPQPPLILPIRIADLEDAFTTLRAEAKAAQAKAAPAVGR
jgi:hypothetical protein